MISMFPSSHSSHLFFHSFSSFLFFNSPSYCSLHSFLPFLHFFFLPFLASFLYIRSAPPFPPPSLRLLCASFTLLFSRPYHLKHYPRLIVQPPSACETFLTRLSSSNMNLSLPFIPPSPSATFEHIISFRKFAFLFKLMSR